MKSIDNFLMESFSAYNKPLTFEQLMAIQKQCLDLEKELYHFLNTNINKNIWSIVYNLHDYYDIIEANNYQYILLWGGLQINPKNIKTNKYWDTIDSEWEKIDLLYNKFMTNKKWKPVSSDTFEYGSGFKLDNGGKTFIATELSGDHRYKGTTCKYYIFCSNVKEIKKWLDESHSEISKRAGAI